MIKKVKGTLNKVLEIDLSSKTITTYKISNELRKLYLGGKGMGLKLLFDRLTPGIDPLGEENIAIMMTGVIAGTSAPCSGRFHAVFKSPLTRIIGSSSCGGSFGRQLKTNGWDGIIIRGRAAAPITIHVHNDKVSFEDAGDLWGRDIFDVQKQIETKDSESLVIGPAGENLVKLANAASGHRFLGRGGFGAVLGSKNLKAIVAHKGNYKILPFSPSRFKELKKRGNAYIKRNEISILNRNYGTASNAAPIIANNMLPVYNFSFGNHKYEKNLTGELIKKRHETEYHTCRPCSILCGHKGTFNGKTTNVPEYETLALLGSSLGIFDLNDISLFNDICNQKGIDTISAGGTLAWVMEATSKGLIKTNLSFGSSNEIVQALHDIASLKGFGKEMAEGTRTLAQKFGGNEFAMQVKGLEMAGYDPRGAYGLGLGYAVANRGACHLSSFPVAFENLLKLLKPDTVKAKPEFVRFLENLYCGINSMDICQFTGYAFTLETLMTKITPKFVLAFLMQNVPFVAIPLVDFSLFPDLFSSVTGIKLSSSQFIRAGERIHVLERYMNTREGIRKKDDVLPIRVLTEPQLDDPKKRLVPLDKMLSKYYRLRGYDDEGIPKRSVLKRLKIKS
jgi:aldehyde:ferredoxin oxidoreductase